MSAYTVTTDPARIDFDTVYRELTSEYWAKGMPAETLRKAIANSLCFSVFKDSKQVGFGRVITDRATYAYLSDVYVSASERGNGVSKLMMEAVMAHPDLQGLRRFALITTNAHKLYDRFGFGPTKNPDWYMEITWPEVYKPKS